MAPGPVPGPGKPTEATDGIGHDRTGGRGGVGARAPGPSMPIRAPGPGARPRAPGRAAAVVGRDDGLIEATASAGPFGGP